jgi:exosortase
VSQVLQAEPGVVRPRRAADDAEPAAHPVLPRLWQAALLISLLSWLYFPTVTRLLAQWWHDPNFSHGFFVPLFAGFLLWQDRLRLAAIKPHPSWAGLPTLIFGLFMLVVGQLGAEIFLSRLSLLIVMAGLIGFLAGWNFFHAVLFPWAFLLLMIPIPNIVFSQITFPLQILASKLAAVTLPWLGVPVLRQGNVILLPAMALEVADACSGIRSLMSLVTLSIIYGYVMEHSLRMRVVLALAAVPIAIVANSLRILGSGLLVQYWDPDKAEGFFHTFQGWIIFVASLGMLYLLHRCIRMIWPEKAWPEKKTEP